MAPPPVPASAGATELPPRVLWVTVRLPSFQIPPPPSPAMATAVTWLLLTLLAESASEQLPGFQIPPPSFEAVFALIVPAKVNVPHDPAPPLLNPPPTP